MPVISSVMLDHARLVPPLGQYNHAIAGGRTLKNDVSTPIMKLGGVAKTFVMISCRVASILVPGFVTQVHVGLAR